MRTLATVLIFGLLAAGTAFADEPAQSSPATRPEAGSPPVGQGAGNSKLIDDYTKAFSNNMTGAFEKLEAANKERQEKAKAYRDAVMKAVPGTHLTVKGVGSPPGTVSVSFIISEAGKLQDLSILKSSGNLKTDQAALLGFQQLSVPVPPVGLFPNDRYFEFTCLVK